MLLVHYSQNQADRQSNKFAMKLDVTKRLHGRELLLLWIPRCREDNRHTCSVLSPMHNDFGSSLWLRVDAGRAAVMRDYACRNGAAADERIAHSIVKCYETLPVRMSMCPSSIFS